MSGFWKLWCNGRENPDCIDRTPVFSWCYQQDYQRNVSQKSFRIELLDRDGAVLFSKKQNSPVMRYAFRGRLTPLTDYFWRLSVKLSTGETLVSERQRFSTGLMGGTMESYGARWIAGTQKYENQGISFCRQLHLRSAVVSAEAYIFTTAWQRLSVNGNVLKEDSRLLPPNSAYQQRCIYEKYDLTAHLHQGENQIAVLTGGGYNSSYSCFGWRLHCGKAMIGFLNIRCADGTTQTVITDESWSVWSSHISYCDIYNGERYDATLVPQRLENAGVIDSPVKKAIFSANEMPPVRVYREIPPISCRKQGRSRLYDLGENFAGVAKITLTAPRGTKIVLQFSELIYSDGSQRTTTNRTAEARDEYICSGEGVECYMPEFTYHGYRYLCVSGITAAVKIHAVTGMAYSADVFSVSSFSCSDGVVNTIHENAVRSLRSNLMSIPTDCPSRGERTPCAMDSLCVETANLYNFNMLSYYSKWLEDITLGADTADDHGNPDWDGDKIILAHRLLVCCGALEPAKRYYRQLKACLEMLTANSPDGLWHVGFGDWCHPNDDNWDSFHNAVTVVNTCLYYVLCRDMAEIAAALGKEKDADAFLAQAEAVKAAFVKLILKPDGTVGEGKHTEQVMALYSGILSPSHRKAVLDKLVEQLGREAPDFGIFGMMALGKVLPQSGHSDLLLRILKRPAYPSYLNQIANGATSLWEQWYFDGSMASHNHSMFGSIEEAFYAGFAGIRPLKNGFAEFEVKPAMPQSMDYVDCAVETVSGVVSVFFRRDPAGFQLRIAVPANTCAHVTLPDCAASGVLHDGERILEEAFYTRGEGNIRFTLGSGMYHLRLTSREYLFENTYESRYIAADE